MSRWIFRAFGAYCCNLPVTRSSNRIPSAMRRSASWMAWLTQLSPCIPIIPRFSGCRAGTAPRPSSVIAAGMSARSTSSRTSAVASERRMPWPARITGRLARLMSAAAARYSAGRGLGVGE